MVVMVELGVAGDVAGDDFGGRRSWVKTNPKLRGTVRHVVRCVGPLGRGDCVRHGGVAGG